MDIQSCCDAYYKNQAGRGDIPVYNPQLGHGFWGNLFRTATSFLKRTVAPNLVKGVANFALDSLAGRNAKDSAKQRARETLGSTLRTVGPAIVKTMTPSNSINRRKRPRISKVSRKHAF
jgi:hypothetical protein